MSLSYHVMSAAYHALGGFLWAMALTSFVLFGWWAFGIIVIMLAIMSHRTGWRFSHPRQYPLSTKE